MIKFNNLTEDDVSYIIKTYERTDIKWNAKLNEVSTKYQVQPKTVEAWFRKLKCTKKVEIVSDQYEKAKNKSTNQNLQRFIISWGQSNTKPHLKFLENIEAYAEFISADIHIIAGRYENPTSLLKSKSLKQVETWDDAIVPYLDANRHNIHPKLEVLSDIKIQPTAINPLSGLHDISADKSCILGSPKIHLEVLPRLDVNSEKILYTTGAVTYKNYSDTKAGKKGEFHHTYGFVIAEIENDDIVHVRQVSAADDGSFSDLFFNVKNGQVNKVSSSLGLVLGDLHCGQHDEELLESTHSIINTLKPENVVLHDVFDGESISHHTEKDPFVQYSNEKFNKNDLQKEIDVMFEVLDSFSKVNNLIIVRGNHDDFIDRWLKNSDWKKQSTPKNYRLYMQLSDILLKQHEEDRVIGVLPELLSKRFNNIKCLTDRESYKIKDWEVGYHGHLGVSGSRGSLMQFRKLNTKTIVGHYHSPERKDGALSVGTSTKLQLNYNKGASKWVQSHVLIHNDGKAQHINFSKNKTYTTLNELLQL
jgi:predicted phosphodiesterase